jgi:hypothetical protein
MALLSFHRYPPRLPQSAVPALDAVLKLNRLWKKKIEEVFNPQLDLKYQLFSVQ